MIKRHVISRRVTGIQGEPDYYCVLDREKGFEIVAKEPSLEAARERADALNAEPMTEQPLGERDYGKLAPSEIETLLLQLRGRMAPGPGGGTVISLDKYELREYLGLIDSLIRRLP